MIVIKGIILTALVSLSTLTASAQLLQNNPTGWESPTEPEKIRQADVWPDKVQPKIAESPVEVFCGVDLQYADVNFLRLYNTLVNLTPGIKLNMGEDWQLAVQMWLPIENNGYDKRYEMVRLSTAAISKELHFSEARQHLKLSAGLFGKERWGVDLKWMMPVNGWLMLQAQGGLTRHWALGFDWHGETESEFTVKDHESTAPKGWLPTGTLGARVYLRPWDTEFVMTGGRYLNKDKGLQVEAMRHFKYCTVTLFGQLHERGNDMYTNHRKAGGFKIIVMLDRKGWNAKTNDKKAIFRPASNFRLTYIAQSDAVSMRSYTTDPEENERILPMRVK